ncbi:MAG TPA: ABC transporter permease [Candidatus Saccharimonadales bacterium]|jgi:ABC-2 type transport system permease protein|nr:ABC transporter permease [Candidatus Saccharimonadales bacterium]
MASNPSSAAVRRTLLRQLVITDFKLRYQGSFLGYFWSLFKPMMMFGVLFVVFTYIIPTGKDVPHFPVYLLLGIVIWTFFIEATTMGLGSIVGRGDLIKKVSISKISIVISSILSAGVNLALNSIIVVIFMLFNGAEVNWLLVPFVPLLLIELIVFAIGLALILSALYVRFRDFAPIWEIILQVLFYATPIIYPFTLAFNAHPTIAQILALSPLTQIIQDLRMILITPATLTTHQVLPVVWSYVIPSVIVLSLITFGYLYFKKRSKYFVEDL